MRQLRTILFGAASLLGLFAVSAQAQAQAQELLSKGLWFLTGGAVCASWWSGPLADTEEGYLLLTIDPAKDDYHWEYIDYGWEVRK